MIFNFEKPKMTGKKKSIRNLVPMYSFDVIKIYNLLGLKNLHRLDFLFTRGYYEFSKNFIVTEPISYDMVYKSSRMRMDRMISDRVALIMLHFHNKVLNFMPVDYPKILIEGIQDKYHCKLGFNDGFEDVLAIKDIYQPLDYFLVLKLGFLLGLNRLNLNSIFADSLQPSTLRKLGATNPDIPFERDIYPEYSHIMKLGFANLTKYAKQNSEIIAREGFFKKLNNGKIICHTDFLHSLNSETKRIQYRKMIGFSPYMNIRFWYALGKSIGIYNPVEVRKQMNMLNVNDIPRYEELAKYYSNLRLTK